MTFDEAMKAVADGRFVTRPDWLLDAYLCKAVMWADSPHARTAVVGVDRGFGTPRVWKYVPEYDDVEATDWEAAS